MGKVIRFPIEGARKSRRQLEETMGGRYIPLEGSGWTSDLEMAISAAQDLAAGAFKSSGCILIFYDKDATTIYRRGLSPEEAEAIIDDYVIEYEAGLFEEDEPA